MTRQEKEQLVAALVRERDGYLKRGQLNRAALVEQQLAKLAAEGKPPARRATRR